ncbi:MAG TPA: hypothetical protein VEJ44_04820, partial [Acidimicrobiales bacterium]|nr:hypothetical protein [Acidimicrobiales bacterium]
ENRTKRLLHPEVGLLSFDLTGLWLGPLTGTRLVTYVPCDDASRQGLEKLAALHPPRPRLEAVAVEMDGATPS